MADYRTHRDKRAVILTLQRMLLDKYMEVDGKEPTDKIICEQAPHNEAIVPQNIFVEIMSDLSAYETYHHTEMLTYSWRKGPRAEGPLPGLDPETDRDVSNESAAQSKKPKRKKKPGPPSEGGTSA